MSRKLALAAIALVVVGGTLSALLAWRFHDASVAVPVFALGIVLTALAVAGVLVLGGRTRAAVREAATRARDLDQAGERLERQDAVLQSIVDNLGDGVALADLDGRLVLFNPAAERILGIGPVDSDPDEWSQVYGLFDPETREPVPARRLPLARAVKGEESRDVDLFVRNPERPGGVFIRVTATPIRDRRGELQGGVAVFRDISERKWAEAVLRDSEARFRAIVEATASALIILSPGGRVQEFNPQAERFFRISRAEALGRDFLELCIPPEFRDAVETDLHAALAGKRTPGFEVPVPSGDGRERLVLWSFSRLADSAERQPVVIATGHDTTERRQAEEARRVRELAAHLQSAREAERAHVARDIHDELGQALTGLKLELSFLARRAGEEGSEIRRRLNDVGRMIDATIMSVRRIAADLRPQILDELGLPDAIRWQVREFEKRSSIDCELEIPEEPVDCARDRATALFRILQEALTNVARHAEASRVTVRICALPEQLVLEVADDGRGITAEQSSGTASFGLLGMRERARMFGGTLAVARAEGGGTAVTATMPY